MDDFEELIDETDVFSQPLSQEREDNTDLFDWEWETQEKEEQVQSFLTGPGLYWSNCTHQLDSTQQEGPGLNAPTPVLTVLSVRAPTERDAIQQTQPISAPIQSPKLPLFEDSASQPPSTTIHQIEQIFSTLLSSLSSNEPLQITLVTSRSPSGTTYDPSTSTLRRTAPKRPHIISFPARTPAEAWRFTVLLKTLDLIHGALVENQISTKRDIYYKHPKLFKKQSVVDRVVEDIACTLGVQRGDLNVVAAAKGLVSGEGLKIILNSGTIVDCGGSGGDSDGGGGSSEGVLIPSTREIKSLQISKTTKWILIVEKEAIFRTLVSSLTKTKTSNTFLKSGIITTGKGYPDLATREFIGLLATTHPNLKIYALVDLDPHGIEILSTYRFGSMCMAHESHRLAVDRVVWIGVKTEDLHDQEDGNNPACGNTGGMKQGLLTLTQRDRWRAVSILKRGYMETVVPEWRLELQRMLFTNIKAEIQILGVGVEEWLEGKMCL